MIPCICRWNLELEWVRIKQGQWIVLHQNQINPSSKSHAYTHTHRIYDPSLYFLSIYLIRFE
jgi:hypothetical protein